MNDFKKSLKKAKGVKQAVGNAEDDSDSDDDDDDDDDLGKFSHLNCFFFFCFVCAWKSNILIRSLFSSKDDDDSLGEDDDDSDSDDDDDDELGKFFVFEFFGRIHEVKIDIL